MFDFDGGQPVRVSGGRNGSHKKLDVTERNSHKCRVDGCN